MTELTHIEAIALLLLTAAAVLSAARLLLGPTTADRLVAADTLNVIAIPALGWWAVAQGNPLYLDIALALAALGFVGIVALARTLEARGS